MKKSLFGKAMQNHSLAMILCCAIPLSLIVILSLTGSLGSWGFYALILLCPLLHVFMMKGHGSTHDHREGPAPSTGQADRLAQSTDAVKDPQGINEELTAKD